MGERCRDNCKEKIKEQTIEMPTHLPCKGCILLAICKSQDKIRCDILWEILRRAVVGKDKEDDKVLDLIQDMFPNTKEIFQYTLGEHPHLSFRWRDKNG